MFVGRYLLETRSRSSNRKGNNPLPGLGLGLIAVGSIGVCFAHVIKSAISRQREFLADASAVQFTRNPLGLAGALKKIGGLAQGSRLQSPAAEEASHMFFGNGLSDSWFRLTQSHPPIQERIRLLDPEFDGRFPSIEVSPVRAKVFTRKPPPLPKAAVVASVSALANVGAPQRKHLQFAAKMMETIPPDLMDATKHPFGAVALVYGLLLGRGASVRQAQENLLHSRAPEGLFNEALKLATMIGNLEDESATASG